MLKYTNCPFLDTIKKYQYLFSDNLLGLYIEGTSLKDHNARYKKHNGWSNILLRPNR